MKISIIIPTYNAGSHINNLFLRLQPYLHSEEYEIIVVDSSSTDKTVEVVKSYGLSPIIIPKTEFNHGGTRNLAALRAKGEILVYLTQDVLPFSEEFIKLLVKPLIDNEAIGLCYGRQIPYSHTSFYGRFARLFNYPKLSMIKSIEDVGELGIKTIFASNSFAAYKKEVLFEVGGFPSNVILGEDTYVAAKIIKKGYKVAYVAEAQVYHSHDYTVWQEFKRYFDTGVFHQREKWLLEEFAKAEGEGLRYVKSEILYAIKNHKAYLLPNIIFRNGIKFLGYRLGRMEKYIPYYVKKRLSMHKGYWDKKY